MGRLIESRTALGVGGGLAALLVIGCGSHTSSLLLERQARGPLVEEPDVAIRKPWVLNPVTQTKTQDGLDVTVTYASPEYLSEFFRNRQIFGGFAGLNPYFSEQMVFYVKLVNHSGKKIRVQPIDFVLLDDKGSQYQVLGPDYNTALAETKAPLATMTRGVLDEAHPGYFGIGVPVGKIIAKPQQRFALLRMATLEAGYLHDGVMYDGLIAFWSPNREAQHLKLLLGNIKTEFNPNDVPQKSLDVPFEFTIVQ